MDRKLANEIIDLISDRIGYFEDKEEEMMDGLLDLESSVTGFYIEKMAKYHKQKKELQDLLKRCEEAFDEGI